MDKERRLLKVPKGLTFKLISEPSQDAVTPEIRNFIDEYLQVFGHKHRDWREIFPEKSELIIALLNNVPVGVREYYFHVDCSAIGNGNYTRPNYCNNHIASMLLEVTLKHLKRRGIKEYCIGYEGKITKSGQFLARAIIRNYEEAIQDLNESRGKIRNFKIMLEKMQFQWNLDHINLEDFY